MEKNEGSTEPNRSKETSSEPTREAKESTGNVSKSFVKNLTIHIELFQSGEKKFKTFFLFFYATVSRRCVSSVQNMLCFLATTKPLFKTNKKKYLRCPR